MPVGHVFGEETFLINFEKRIQVSGNAFGGGDLELEMGQLKLPFFSCPILLW